MRTIFRFATCKSVRRATVCVNRLGRIYQGHFDCVRPDFGRVRAASPGLYGPFGFAGGADLAVRVFGDGATVRLERRHLRSTGRMAVWLYPGTGLIWCGRYFLYLVYCIVVLIAYFC